jgi:uncharacterized membrane-anchored protein YhcB (DUF1043 family)
MTLKFNITQEEYAEFTKHFYKKLFTGSWKWYVGIAVVLIAFNLIVSTNRQVIEIENGESTSVSYTSTLLNWLFFLVLFGGLWWFILKRQLSPNGKSFLNWKFFLIAFPILYFLGMYLDSFESTNDWIIILSAFFNWLSLIALFVGIWLFIVNRFKKSTNANQDNEKMLGEREMIIEENRVQLSTKFSETTYKWDAFIKYEQTTSMYLIFITSKSAILIPKRVFESPHQQSEFEALVKRKMPDSSKMTNLKNPNVLDA